MPCWEVRTISVEFKAENRDLLEDAVKSLGWSFRKLGNGVYQVNDMTLDLNQGKAEIGTNQQSNLNRLKVAYSQAAVRKVAKQKGWQCKFDAPTKGKFIKKQWG